MFGRLTRELSFTRLPNLRMCISEQKVNAIQPFGLETKRVPTLIHIEIRVGNFYKTEMIRNTTGQEFMDVKISQKYFVLAVCYTLEYRFEDNHIMTVFKVLDRLICRQNKFNWLIGGD